MWKLQSFHTYVYHQEFDLFQNLINELHFYPGEYFSLNVLKLLEEKFLKELQSWLFIIIIIIINFNIKKRSEFE